MGMSAQTTHPIQNTEFDAAKRIVEALQGLSPDQQSRALRWASESLGLSGVAPAQAQVSHAAGVGSQATGNTFEPSAATQGGTQDIRSFVRSKNPKSDMQLCAAVAYYYRFVAPTGERKDAITASDLQEAIRLIGNWEQPKRPTDTLHNAKKQGYLDQTTDGAFRLNSIGENLVTMTLGNSERSEIVTRSRKPRGNHSRSSKPAKKAAKK